MRLRRSDCAVGGIGRRRRGHGFSYYWNDDGRPVDDPEALRRIRELVIPPAWREVWICPYPNGHIQAVGRDDAGRLQYIYHHLWRSRRDAEKHRHVLHMARALPAVRDAVNADLAGRGLNRRRVLATAVRLLDRGLLRIGGEQYADENDTYGLATIRREHVTVQRDGVVVLDYPAKSGQEWAQSIADRDVAEVVRRLLRRRDSNPRLLGYWERGRWHDVRSADINEHLKELFGFEVTAKDFRTWHATVIAAIGLGAAGEADSRSARKRVVTRVTKEVAEELGNTPAVARNSYIDPRVVDRYYDGDTIDSPPPGSTDGAEQAVIALLDEG